MTMAASIGQREGEADARERHQERRRLELGEADGGAAQAVETDGQRVLVDPDEAA
jgi:hypothetical protein